MGAALAVLLITLGLGQLGSTRWELRGASLVGPGRLAGYGLGLLLFIAGALILPARWDVLWWTVPAGLVTVILLLLGGTFIVPPPHPNRLFSPRHPAHAGCQAVQIPDGDYLIPGLLLHPPDRSLQDEKQEQPRSAVCIIPGAGDTKISFKWRLVQSLLAEGLMVLTIDPPGHGEYRQRPLSYDNGLSTVVAAVRFLRQRAGATRVGLIGISLGGAIAIRSLVENPADGPDRCACVDALVVVATPVQLNYGRGLFYREAWNTYRAPVLSLLRETNFRQILQGWYTGGYRSQHSTADMLIQLNPVEGIRQVKDIPTLLVYGGRDRIAPPEAAQSMLRAAPWVRLLSSKKASHVTLTLIPEVNKKMVHWLKEHLVEAATE